MSATTESLEEIQIPEEFHKIIKDFIGDILTTFPEYSGIISRWYKGTENKGTENKGTDKGTDNNESDNNDSVGSEIAFRHCLKVFPERFFDILYKNTEIFSKDSEVNTEFLPGIVFKQLWSYDISDKTRETIWKYLQLTLFAVIGSVHSSSALGETAKLFEAINEDELKTKLQETMENMSNLFNIPSSKKEDESKDDVNDDSGSALPNADDIHKHIHEMMGGKLGKLAMELAEETASDLNLDMDNATNANDVFQQLFKNPTKMMSMVKNIGGKLDEKIKSGELKESELMSEGMELLNKMQTMPGMDNIQKMFSQMGIPGLGKKMNMGAMEAQMNKNMKAAQMKERMKAKATTKADKNANAVPCPTKPVYTEEELCKIFSAGEKAEKTPRGAKPPTKEPVTKEPVTKEPVTKEPVTKESVKKESVKKDKKKKK
jgi:hypothetical protein